MIGADEIERLTRADPHDYLSTACLHGKHDRCRLSCVWEAIAWASQIV
jgi:hypothetical protein